MMSATIRMRGLGRIDVRVADHELLQDVVLDRPGELLARHALLFGRDDEAGQRRDARRRSWSSTRSCGRAGCRRTGSSCPRRSRSRRPPCPRRRPRAGGRSRSRGASRDRTRPRGPSARRQVRADRSAFESSAVEKPAYWRMVHGRFAYIVARGPRRYGDGARASCRGARVTRGPPPCTAPSPECLPASARPACRGFRR